MKSASRDDARMPNNQPNPCGRCLHQSARDSRRCACKSGGVESLYGIKSGGVIAPMEGTSDADEHTPVCSCLIASLLHLASIRILLRTLESPLAHIVMFSVGAVVHLPRYVSVRLKLSFRQPLVRPYRLNLLPLHLEGGTWFRHQTMARAIVLNTGERSVCRVSCEVRVEGGHDEECDGSCQMCPPQPGEQNNTKTQGGHCSNCFLPNTPLSAQTQKDEERFQHKLELRTGRHVRCAFTHTSLPTWCCACIGRF